jgi:hypothetical protein
MPGTYTVTVVADGTSGTCEVAVPVASCQTASLDCTGTHGWILDGPNCALPTDRQGIGGITFGGSAPGNIEVVVEREGRRLGAGTFSPTYQMSQPNGPDCPPICFSAPSESLAIQP